MMKVETAAKINEFVHAFAGCTMDHYHKPTEIGTTYPCWATLKRYGVIVKTGKTRTATPAETWNGATEEVNLYRVMWVIVK